MYCLFLVRASAEIGIGHLMRCYALSQALNIKHYKVVFLLDDETASLAKELVDWSAEIIDSDYSLTAKAQLNRIQACRQNLPDWVIVDGYQFDSQYCKTWRDAGFKVVLFDDGVFQTSLSADLVINASARGSHTKEGIPLLSGTEYRLLRDEFNHFKIKPVEDRSYLTISMGGSDPLNITWRLLEELEKLNFSGLIKVVTGQAYPFLDKLQSVLETTALNVIHIHAAQNMAEVWNDSRLAVSAAGGSQFELAVCATPSILFVVADNQLGATKIAENEGWCCVFDVSGKADVQQVINEVGRNIVLRWSDVEMLKRMHNAIIGQYDALGAQRIIETLESHE